jgi:hypothetical protein
VVGERLVLNTFCPFSLEGCHADRFGNIRETNRFDNFGKYRTKKKHFWMTTIWMTEPLPQPRAA